MPRTCSRRFLIIVFLLFSITRLLILVTECRTEDKKEETRRTYYASEKIKTEARYLNGKLDGVSKRYYENGILWSETNYKNGKREGVAKEYYLNGKIKADLIYEGGRLKSGKLYNMQGKEIMGDMTKAK
jgi:antitoxin component YwqK of YwqJK toxin-antitoxin module